jgi:hypothetical protein
MQAFSAERFPILRGATRWPIPLGMSGNEIIDYDGLRQLVIDGLPAFKSPRAVSLKATGGKNPDLIRNFLTGTNPQLPGVVGICTVMSIPLHTVMNGLDEIPGDEASASDGVWLVVNGEVEAGVFRAQTEWGPEDWYEVEVEPIDDGHRHHGLLVKGRSMDRTFPPGTVLRVEDAISSELPFAQDDYVIVEHRKGDLVELTCKKVNQRPDGSFELIAESFLLEYREPIYIGKPIETADGPGFDHITDDEIRVRAIVIDAYLPLRRRRTRMLKH